MNLREQLQLAFFEESAPTQSSISSALGITIKQVKKLQEKHHEKLKYIQSVRAKFRQKKYIKIDKKRGINPDFRFKDFYEFYFWYRVQPRVCSYCKTKETILYDLYTTETISSKRGVKRGRSLEIERKDSASNLYNKTNCILACYFCNNHKSDIISEDEHIKYFAKHIHSYLIEKWKTSNKSLERNS